MTATWEDKVVTLKHDGGGLKLSVTPTDGEAISEPDRKGALGWELLNANSPARDNPRGFTSSGRAERPLSGGIPMMKLAYAICIALGLGIGMTHAAGTGCQTTSTRLLDHLDQGDYAGATADFDVSMKTDLGADRLARIWPAVSQQFGARGAREQPQLSQKDGRTLVITPLHYGRHLIDARVSCDADGKIGGFYIKAHH